MQKEFRKLVRKILSENYPVGAQFRSDAPWNKETNVKEPKSPKSKEFSIESIDTKSKTAHLKNLNDDSMWLFYYGDIEKEDFEPYAEITRTYLGKDEEGNAEYEYDENWEVNGDVIEKYVNDNIDKVTIGAGMDDFESGKNFVKIDDSEQKNQ